MHPNRSVSHFVNRAKLAVNPFFKPVVVDSDFPYHREKRRRDRHVESRRITRTNRGTR